MQRHFTTIGIVLAVGLFLVFSSAYTVHQTEQALVLEFGKAVKVVDKPGLKFKWPFIQNVVFFDNRMLEFNADQKEVSAADRKRLIVDAFVRYRITNPLQFYRAAQDEQRMNSRLNTILDSSLRQVIGSVPLTDVLSEKRVEIMRQIRDMVRAQVNSPIVKENGKKESASFGIEVMDVRIMRSDLPAENSESVYRAMKANFEKEAKKYRAEGAEEAQRITASADKDRTILLAESQKKADIVRGEGDAEAGRIYAQAFGKDEEFFRFYRSLQAYRLTLNKDNTTMLLSPQSEFLRYLDKAAAGSQ